MSSVFWPRWFNYFTDNEIFTKKNWLFINKVIGFLPTFVPAAVAVQNTTVLFSMDFPRFWLGEWSYSSKSVS